MNDKIFDFETVTPESVGVDSTGVIKFLESLEERKLNMHSIIGLRHGKIFFEGYYSPMSKDRKHRMYSISKSFVSAAIGLLYDEGRISLDDKIVKYFPDHLPENPDPNLMNVTIRDMLMMSTCYDGGSYDRDTPNWTHSFFNSPSSHPSGTIFNYDTSGTNVLNVLVERLTGKPFLEYMKDKMLRELGFSEDAWCVKMPEGNSWGGSGVICTTRDLARFALAFLNRGNIGGKQYLSGEYIDMATSKQIDNNRTGYIDDCITGYGYGYFIWRTWRNAYTMWGMGGQYALCIPEKDMLFVINADNQGTNDSATLFPSLWDNIITPAKDSAITENATAYAALNNKLSTLSLPVPMGEAVSPYAEKINGVTYTFSDNNLMGITKLRFELEGDHGALYYTNRRGDKKITFGLGKFVNSTFPETSYYGDTMLTPADREYLCTTAAVWSDPSILLVRCNIIDDYFGNLTMSFGFKKDKKVSVYMVRNAEWFLDDYGGIAEGTAE